MRIAVNLATRPYVEMGPIYKRLRLLILALAVLAVPLWLVMHSESRKAAAAHARLAASQQRLTVLERQEQGYRSDMRLPQNASVLRQSQFLNALFAHKAFSWTAVMMDLEKVLPGGVQVENIDPTIARDGTVTIRLRVSGDHDRAVELVRNLEHSKRFLLPRLADEAAETNSQGGRGFVPVSGTGVNMDILAEYNPLPLPPETAAASKSSSAKSSSAKSGSAKSSSANSRPSRSHASNSGADTPREPLSREPASRKPDSREPASHIARHGSPAGTPHSGPTAVPAGPSHGGRIPPPKEGPR